MLFCAYCQKQEYTRLHSSRMRTARALTKSPNMLCGGVSVLGECLLLGGVSAPWGGIPVCTEADTPLLTESQTPEKTLPCPNFVAGGNKPHETRSTWRVKHIPLHSLHKSCYSQIQSVKKVDETEEKICKAIHILKAVTLWYWQRQWK